MGPGRFGGFGPSAAAVLAACVVAVVVVAMVAIGGGLTHPLISHTHVAIAQSSQPQG
jgi:hypothetical protein